MRQRWHKLATFQNYMHKGNRALNRNGGQTRWGERQSDLVSLFCYRGVAGFIRMKWKTDAWKYRVKKCKGSLSGTNEKRSGFRRSVKALQTWSKWKQLCSSHPSWSIWRVSAEWNWSILQRKRSANLAELFPRRRGAELGEGFFLLLLFYIR